MSLGKSKESLTVKLLEVNSLSKGTKNFTHLLVSVFMADRIGLN